MSTSAPSTPAIAWVLKRNCSAGPRLLAVVFVSLVSFSFVIALAFASIGLWGVLPFVGLELAALAAAFVCFGRRVGDYERIELVDGQVRIERHRRGRTDTWTSTAAWTRVESPRDAGRDPVRLVSAGRAVEVGGLLGEAGRRRLAHDLRCALRAAG